MELKTLLREQIERELKYQRSHEVGTEEYNDSLRRLGTLEDKLAEVEKLESENVRKDVQMKEEKTDRLVKNIIEGVKVGGSIVLPIVGLVAIMAFEKSETFTTSLRGFVNCFLPRKL